MRYSLLFGLAVGVLWLTSCQKEEVQRPASNAQQAVSLQRSERDSRDTLAGYILRGLEVDAFSQALYEGFSTMRDGDTEVLLAELMYPSRLRSASWQQRAHAAFSEVLSDGTRRLRGVDIVEQVLGGYLQRDPLVQLLLVAPRHVASSNALMQDPNLHVAVWPRGKSDNFPFMMRAYNRKGQMVEIPSNEQPDFPVIVVGENERVRLHSDGIEGSGMHEGDDLYHISPLGEYRSKGQFLLVDETMGEGMSEHEIPIDDDGGGHGGGDDDTEDQDVGNIGGGGHTGGNSGSSGLRLRKDIPNGAEILVKAGFKTHDDLVAVEPWGKGRPEMRCVTRANSNNLENDLRFGDRGWYYGNIKWLDNRLFPWSSLAQRGDFYSVLWLEEDGGSQTQYIIRFQHEGEPDSYSVRVDCDDDIIGLKAVCYTDPLYCDGLMYDIGMFWFWIDVRSEY